MTNTGNDLTISRVLKAPRTAVWQAWSDPSHFAKWWTPSPVMTTVKKFELHAGGAFHTLMTMADGSEMDGGEGCFLEVIPQERIVFTDALAGGWRPNEEAFFSAIITMDDHAEGTLYTSTALHKNDADRKTHEEMGFLDGWGACISQLETLAQELGGAS